ncbi:hypothetical protein AVEN_31936-1 [Araneus ventricosus]|uniref:F-box/LRR-repeat protein 18 LRR domain-containing protein n=1 Tax=Araneus ventricosus TaxID=182803 RepID=A0A4Y2QGZ4_ARAVE|nr:hypothetical protein AVEN_31936-1 [Araneus ventricosus]
MSHNISLQDKQSDSSNRAPDAWLCTLPTEILTIIFSYLSPQSLVTIRELGVKRLTEISLSLKVADFSQCNTVLTEDVSSFFTKDRVEHVKEISFDNIFFIKPFNLEKYIVKCKHLTVLSVIECGLSYANILCIFQNCSALEELYWSLCIKKAVPTFENTFENVKKLYLCIKEPKYLEYVVITKILEMCPKALDVCLNFSPYFSRTLPPEIARTVCTGRIFYKNREHPVSVVASTTPERFLGEANSVMDHLSCIDKLNIEDVFINGEDMSFFLPYYSSYLQFITEERDLSKLSSVPDDSVHSLVLIMTDKKADLLNHIEKIKKVAGFKLQHLTLHNTSSPSTLMHQGRLIEASGGAFMCDILTRIVSNSLNISVLNLSELHYDIAFPFSALYCLKQLKALSLSACTIKESAFDYEPSFEAQVKGFNGLVENCKNVEKFSFLGCLWCQFGPADEGLADVYKWKKLKSFTLANIDTFRICPFLVHIANNCPDFQSLELIEVGEASVCHYVDRVIHIIRKSKKLFFLRINQAKFNPAQPLFWKSLESARNLQGICLTTRSSACVENKLITDALRKLPFLHIFHLAAPRICQNLPSQVKQIITRNEVQTYTMRVVATKEDSYESCDLMHFPTF